MSIFADGRKNSSAKFDETFWSNIEDEREEWYAVSKTLAEKAAWNYWYSLPGGNCFGRRDNKIIAACFHPMTLRQSRVLMHIRFHFRLLILPITQKGQLPSKMREFSNNSDLTFNWKTGKFIFSNLSIHSHRSQSDSCLRSRSLSCRAQQFNHSCTNDEEID